MIDAITSADISRFIPSEFGHDSLNEKIQARLPAYKERAETIKYLEQVAEDGRLSWSAAATGTTLDRGIVNGSLGFDLAWRSATLHGSGDEKFAASSVAWIGKVVATMLRSWEAVEGKYLHAAGLVTCANEVVQCLSIAMGKQWDAEPGDVEVCVMEAEQRIEKGFVDAGMFLLERSLMYDESLVATRPFRERDSLKSLGMEGETVEEVVRAALHESEHHRAGGGGCGCD